jgi:hypothetical protein
VTLLQALVGPRHGLATLRRRAGLPLRLRCDERCTVTVSGTVPRAVARSLRIAGRGRTITIATARTTTLRAGRPTTLALTLSRATARRLARAARIALTLSVVARDRAGNRTTKRVTLTLRR